MPPDRLENDWIGRFLVSEERSQENPAEVMVSTSVLVTETSHTQFRVGDSWDRGRAFR
jgi:hypothetical protein